MMKDITTTFWGVRGSIACPGLDYAKYGGNTSCVEVRCGDNLIILDAGTGIRLLGKKLVASGAPVKGHILFSHTHYDHVEGLPFFEPFYKAGNSFALHAGHLAPPENLREVLGNMMAEPLFPVPLDIFDATMSYLDFVAGEDFSLGEGIEVSTSPLNHPNGACGYRITYQGKSICYITDTEHRGDQLDTNILRLIKDADLFIYDATYSGADYPSFKGWGHSTREVGYKLAEAAQVKNYVIFHHNPDYNDEMLDDVSQQIKSWVIPTQVACEGMSIVV